MREVGCPCPARTMACWRMVGPWLPPRLCLPARFGSTHFTACAACCRVRQECMSVIFEHLVTACAGTEISEHVFREQQVGDGCACSGLSAAGRVPWSNHRPQPPLLQPCRQW